jgi:hypothetical protein
MRKELIDQLQAEMEALSEQGLFIGAAGFHPGELFGMGKEKAAENGGLKGFAGVLRMQVALFIENEGVENPPKHSDHVKIFYGGKFGDGWQDDLVDNPEAPENPFTSTAKEVGNLISEALKNAGFNVEWDGAVESVIRIYEPVTN